MEYTWKNFIKKNILAVILVVIVSLIVVIFLAGYLYIHNNSYNSYSKSLNKCIKTINTSNATAATLLYGQSIDTEKSKRTLPKIIDILQKTEVKIKALPARNQYKSYQASLTQGINSNINIYTQLLSILSNPEAFDIGGSRDNLKHLKDTTINFYSQASAGNIDISLPQNSIKYIDSSIYYVEQLVKLKNNQDINYSETLDFTYAVDAIFKRFLVIKTDFGNIVYTARSGQRSYDEILKVLDTNKNSIMDIKIDYDKISVPPNSDTIRPIVIYNSLETTLNDYSSYIDSFTYALTAEKCKVSTNKNINKNVLDKLYIESNLKLATVTNDYNNFVQIYNTYKNPK